MDEQGHAILYLCIIPKNSFKKHLTYKVFFIVIVMLGLQFRAELSKNIYCMHYVKVFFFLEILEWNVTCICESNCNTYKTAAHVLDEAFSPKPIYAAYLFSKPMHFNV